MSLFNRKQTHSSNNHQNPKPLHVIDQYTLKQSSSFRGYRRVRLTCYGYQPVQDNMELLRIPNPEYTDGCDLDKYYFDFTGMNITLKIGTFLGDNYCVFVFADKYHVGTIFPDSSNDEIISAIMDHQISKVYLKIEWEPTIVYSKGHFGRLKENIEERYRAYIFVKSADGSICSKKSAN